MSCALADGLGSVPTTEGATNVVELSRVSKDLLEKFERAPSEPERRLSSGKKASNPPTQDPVEKPSDAPPNKTFSSPTSVTTLPDFGDLRGCDDELLPATSLAAHPHLRREEDEVSNKDERLSDLRAYLASKRNKAALDKMPALPPAVLKARVEHLVLKARVDDFLSKAARPLTPVTERPPVDVDDPACDAEEDGASAGLDAAASVEDSAFPESPRPSVPSAVPPQQQHDVSDAAENDAGNSAEQGQQAPKEEKPRSAGGRLRRLSNSFLSSRRRSTGSEVYAIATK